MSQSNINLMPQSLVSITQHPTNSGFLGLVPIALRITNLDGTGNKMCQRRGN